MCPKVEAEAERGIEEIITQEQLSLTICPSCYGDLDEDRYCVSCRWFPLATCCDICGGWTDISCSDRCPDCMMKARVA